MLALVHDLDELMGSFARHQGGLVTRRQLIGTGSRPSQIDGLLTRRRIRAVAAGVYAIAGAPTPPDQPSWTAVLATGGLLTGEHLLACLGVEGATFDGPPMVVVHSRRRRGPATPWSAVRCARAQQERGGATAAWMA